MAQRHLSSSSIVAAVAAVAALSLPGIAAAEYWHPASNEAGVIVHENHFKSEKTRAQVKAETEIAARQGGLSYGEGYSMPAFHATVDKTREQVTNALRSESPAERDARLRFLAG